jgi:GT2 family glycosyltransferase/SAM-dependent methyltransferase
MVSVATLVVSRNRPDLVDRQIEALAKIKLPNDIYVVEMGTTPDKMSKWSNIHYADSDFRGKCFGHNVALNFARQVRKYDYYLVAMNDVFMNFDGDPVARMIDYMDRYPDLGLISPTCEDKGYPSSARAAETGLRAVTTFDYLCFLIRGELVERIGFLNPDFKYSWGAIHELTFKMYRSGYFAAYLDDFNYTHLGGTTYGAPGTNTISRQDYQRNAGRFASDYFRTTYGPDWSNRFWETTWHYPIAHNTYTLHRRYWASGFSPEELQARGEAVPDDMRQRPDAKTLRETSKIRLHLGCGQEYRPGWINIDGNSEVKHDLLSSVVDLPYFGDASSDVIEANHVFEHLTRDDAEKAMAEYARILRPGGALFLELPNADRSRQMLGAQIGSEEYELGSIGNWGYTPDIRAEGVLQIHKFGWSPETLMKLMKGKGFTAAFPQPVTQTDRPAYRYRRDMRICGIR